MRRLALVIMLALAVNAARAAMTWIDVTDRYVTNPRYDGGSLSGWSGTPLGAVNARENAEHYQKSYDTYQTLEGLAPGKYRLSLDAFYRMGSAGNDYSLYASGDYRDYQYAELYASSSGGEAATPIAPSASGMSATSLGGGTSTVGGYYYTPNNMVAADFWFEAGHYDNSLEVTVGTDGVLTIGIRKSSVISEDWTCIDNWKLEFQTTLVPVTAITVDRTALGIVTGERYTLNAAVAPSNATHKSVRWTSSNTAVAAVDADGTVTAVGTGTATITATAADGTGVRATCAVTVSVPVAPTAENIVINEIMAANVDVYRDPSTNFGPWVELYNPTDRGVNLGGLYVTTDITDLRQHRLVDYYGVLGAHGYAMLNFGHREVWTRLSYRQIDGKLDTDGGTVIVSDGTKVLAMQDYPAAISRTSYARTTDGGAEWGVTGAPSPGADNAAGGGFAATQVEAPAVTPDGQLFDGTISVSVTIPAGATLRYTTDGSTPTLTNGHTSASGRFTVSDTRCYRFRLYKDGMLPSRVVSRSYILNGGNEPFPIISLVMDNSTLFNSDYGIFQYSDYGRPGNGQGGNYNANMDWDRPVNFEYITTNNECVINQECDFSACGGWSRAFSPHSFKLKAGKTYDGRNFFNHQFFAEKPFLKHKTLQIRNGGNDTGARIKDAALTQVVARSGLNVEYQSWQPVHVYINGEPYAVLNMREPNNKHYGYANYGIDTDFMDQFEISPDSGYVQKEGTMDAFLRWYDLSATASTAASYDEICKIVDIDAFVNYMAVEFYLGNTDWPQNNVKAFRDVNGGKFRFVIFDTDHAFGTSTPLTTFFDKVYRQSDMLYGYDYSTNTSIEGTRRTPENKFVVIFRNMLANDTFRKKFTDAFCIVAGSVFTPERCAQIINEVANTEALGGYVDPWGTANSLINSLGSNRQTTLINHLKSVSDMQLSSITPQRVTLASNISGAGLLVNGQEVPTGQFTGQLFAPVTLTAKAPAGYEFAGWKSDGGATDDNSVNVFYKGAEWKYYDKGSLDGENWTAATFGDSDWDSGATPIGYGKSQPTTTAGRLVTYYFRKSFTIDNALPTDGYTLNFTIDDGAVVYVNGREAGRYNMPSGTITYNTYATTYAPGNPDESSMTLDASLFRTGENIIAVEVHNNNATSSDIVWNAQLVRSTVKDANAAYVSTEKEYTLPATGAHSLTAVWTRMADGDLDRHAAVPVKVNEASPGNDMYINDYAKKDDWVELYNTTDTDIDVCGLYLSDDAASPQKYQITAAEGVNTIIPARGHLVVWCSKRVTDKQLHASFKLSNTDGSMVMLSSSPEFVSNNEALFSDGTAYSQTFTDTLVYKAVPYDRTVGRYPDGGSEYFVMHHPTIGRANTMQMANTLAGKDTVRDFMTLRGDVNGDGQVTIADANMVANHFLGQGNGGVFLNEAAADVNGDGQITIADANEIVNIFLGN